MIRLHVVPARGAPFDHLFEGASLVVGRSSRADLVLDDRYLSRRHSRLFREGDRLMIEDLGSRNGTLVNLRPVSRPRQLAVGDEIRISGSVLSVGYVGEAPASTEPATGPEREYGDGTVFFSASEVLESQATLALSGGVRDEKELRRVAERLELLNDIHEALGRSMALDELLELILERAFDHLKPEQGAVFLRAADGTLGLEASRSPSGESGEVLTSKNLAREVVEQGNAALIFDLASDRRFSAAESMVFSGIRSLIAAPLLDPAGPLGMIVLSSKAAVKEFQEDDLKLLVSLASVAALRIRNVALAEEAAERRRLEKELALARRIQLALLPDRLPELAGYEIYGGSVPSQGVSGDYFLVVEREAAGEAFLMLADVSGKGISAALLTASLEALAAGPIEEGRPPDEICARVSRRLHSRTPVEKFATAFLASLDLEEHTLRYTNAGHEEGLLLRRDGTLELLGTCGFPLGMMSEGEYSLGEARLEPGDLLVVYSDGITDAFDPDGEDYGVERLVELCRKHGEAPLEDLAAALVRDLERFARSEPFADDRTLVMVRRRP